MADDSLSFLGRTVAFIRRLREIRASAFVWSVVLSRFGDGRPAFEQARQWYRRLGGPELWPRPDIAVIDSNLLQLADQLHPVFKGTRGAKPSLKARLTISVFGLLPLDAKVVAGNRHDMVLFPELDIFRAGTLLLFDKGFVAYERLAKIARSSLHFLCPMRMNGNATIIGIRYAPKHVRDALRRSPNGVRLRDVLPAKTRIGKTWDVDVRLTSGNVNGRRPIQTDCRLVIADSGPKFAQRRYLTNLVPNDWSPRALAESYRLRWQVELVFKELKQHLNLGCLVSKDRHAVQVFAWASLIALARRAP